MFSAQLQISGNKYLFLRHVPCVVFHLANLGKMLNFKYVEQISTSPCAITPYL